jgi:hypothetical protein
MIAVATPQADKAPTPRRAHDPSSNDEIAAVLRYLIEGSPDQLFFASNF